MRKTTQAAANRPGDAGITLSLSEEQLKALGLSALPTPGAKVQLRATATIAQPNDVRDTRDADHDGDQDSGGDVQGGDTDGDGAEQGDQTADENASAEAAAPAPALTLHLTGLTLVPVHRTPDKVLYGSGD